MNGKIIYPILMTMLFAGCGGSNSSTIDEVNEGADNLDGISISDDWEFNTDEGGSLLNAVPDRSGFTPGPWI